MKASNMDVLFVDFPSDFLFPESNWCLGFRYMISMLRENGFSSSILHPRRCSDGSMKMALIEDILQANPSIVGFTTYDINIHSLLLFIKELRNAGLRCHVTLGGMCASAIPELILQKHHTVDSIVFGEGEHSIVDLARYVIRKDQKPPIPGVCLRIDNVIVRGEARPLIEDLDALPEPALDDIIDPQENSPLYYVNGRPPVLTSKGCYGRCTFCSIQKFYRSCPGKAWRGRSAASVVNEVSNLSRVTGFDTVTFVDENFMGPGKLGRQRAIEIAKEIKQRNLSIRFNFGCRPNDVDRNTFKALKDAGLTATSLGIESMSPDTLRLFNKLTTPEINYNALQILESLKLFVEITFIFFQPLSTVAEIRDNVQFIEFVRNSKYTYFNNNHPFTEFIPFWGTELTSYYENLGLVKRDLDGYSVQYKDPLAGFIAQSIRDIPVDYLSRLRYQLPTEGSQRLMDIQAALGEYEIYLKMVKLPGLIFELCELFDRGASISADKVRTVVAELKQEKEKIYSLIQLITSHIP